ncbi:HAD family hydrolase [Actinomadura scrupuli]|uniref:HAD family hydrolase n=1 Tax=Actinomadura scrupuli TaxID=559629 RepID=UPI003D95F9DE
MIRLSEVEAVIFDTDGVVTDTARLHAAAWKVVFDAFLRGRAIAAGTEYRPFDEHADYLRYVDGKPRSEGIRDFLTSRGVQAGGRAVAEMGDRKDALYMDQVRHGGVVAFPSSVALVRALRSRHVRTAVVSASRNCAEVLSRAGVSGLFDVRVDGVESARLGLAGKPDPALFLEAARRLGVPPERTAVVEDALAGVSAGRRGGFGLVIGVDRNGQAPALLASGADLVVADLSELTSDGSDREPLAADL